MRPLMDVEAAADAIQHIIENPEEAKLRAKNAYKWVSDHRWIDVCHEWKDLFNEAYQSLEKKRNFLKSLNNK